jgi:hypothetical protein
MSERGRRDAMPNKISRRMLHLLSPCVSFVFCLCTCGDLQTVGPFGQLFNLRQLYMSASGNTVVFVIEGRSYFGGSLFRSRCVATFDQIESEMD